MTLASEEKTNKLFKFYISLYILFFLNSSFSLSPDEGWSFLAEALGF